MKQILEFQQIKYLQQIKAIIKIKYESTICKKLVT